MEKFLRFFSKEKCIYAILGFCWNFDGICIGILRYFSKTLGLRRNRFRGSCHRGSIKQVKSLNFAFINSVLAPMMIIVFLYGGGGSRLSAILLLILVFYYVLLFYH